MYFEKLSRRLSFPAGEGVYNDKNTKYTAQTRATWTGHGRDEDIQRSPLRPICTPASAF